MSISVDDLIRLIEEKGATNVTAKNNGSEFESLEDIKAHKGLLAGNPTISFDDAYLNFEPYILSVTLSYNAAILLNRYVRICEEGRLLPNGFLEFKLFQDQYMIPTFILFGIHLYVKKRHSCE